MALQTVMEAVSQRPGIKQVIHLRYIADVRSSVRQLRQVGGAADFQVRVCQGVQHFAQLGAVATLGHPAGPGLGLLQALPHEFELLVHGQAHAALFEHFRHG